MTFGEVEFFCREVRDMAEAAMASRSSHDAAAVRIRCRYLAGKLRGRFGNVAERLDRVADAAAHFATSCDKQSAKTGLHEAVKRMRLAIDIHRAATQRL
jgi:hypothetical protein